VADRTAVVYIGLGSNLGNRRARLERAVELIRRRAPVLALSSFYRTDPVGHTDQPDFVNAVAKIAWRGSPEDLLACLQRIEARLGRIRRFQNGPREIDLDLLDFGGVVRPRPDPVLPHPRMSGRRFVLAPLSEIAPRWRHPVSWRTARQLLARLPARPSADRLGS